MNDHDDRDDDQASRLEQRVTELEIKASFIDDLLDGLNRTVVAQQQKIELLVREITRLKEQVPEGGGALIRSLRDEMPPHY
jgi:SlyX protein